MSFYNVLTQKNHTTRLVVAALNLHDFSFILVLS